MIPRSCGRVAIFSGILVLASCTNDGGTNATLPAQLVEELDSTEQKILHHEELIASCMTGRGFEYMVVMPADWVAERARVQAVEAGASEDELDEVVFDALERGRQLAAPQIEYLDSLSVNEADAYHAALVGQRTGDDPGCFDETYDDAWGSLPEVVLEHLDDDSVSLAGAIDDYVTCMKGQGFEVSSTSDVFRQLHDERERLKAAGSGPSASSYIAFEESARSSHRACMEAYDAASEKLIEQATGG